MIARSSLYDVAPIDLIGMGHAKKAPPERGHWVSVSISSFGTLPLHNLLAVQGPPTDQILLSLPFPSAFEPAKDRWGRI